MQVPVQLLLAASCQQSLSLETGRQGSRAHQGARTHTLLRNNNSSPRCTQTLFRLQCIAMLGPQIVTVVGSGGQ